MSTLNRAVPETHLEVDLLILDYLLYMATRTLLQEQVILREEGVQEVLSQQPMRMIDCKSRFLNIMYDVSLTKSSLHPSLQMQPPNRTSAGRYQLQTTLDQVRVTLQQARHPL